MQGLIDAPPKTENFNTEAGPSVYTFRRSPVHKRAFQILKKSDPDADEPVVVGDYTVLDENEDYALAELKVMNLVGLFNGRKKLMQLGHETNTRILYRILNSCDDNGMTQILFYALGKEGVSVENALFRIERKENVS